MISFKLIYSNKNDSQNNISYSSNIEKESEFQASKIDSINESTEQPMNESMVQPMNEYKS